MAGSWLGKGAECFPGIGFTFSVVLLLFPGSKDISQALAITFPKARRGRPARELSVTVSAHVHSCVHSTIFLNLMRKNRLTEVAYRISFLMEDRIGSRWSRPSPEARHVASFVYRKRNCSSHGHSVCSLSPNSLQHLF